MPAPAVVSLAGDAPGHGFELRRFRFAPPAGKAPCAKVYLQGALHADEQPGILILHHLLPLLARAERAGRLRAAFVVFPMVNPLGMDGLSFHRHQGRYHALSALNFNRRWPDLSAAVAAEVIPRLGADGSANVRLVREAVGAYLEALSPTGALASLRREVMREAFDADIVLDLHCDEEALPHIFTVPQSAEVACALGARAGAAAVLTAEDSGGGSFDEVWSSLWLRLAQAAPDKPVPLATFSATLEYRGIADVCDETNRRDAENLFDFFVERGLIEGTPSPCPNPVPVATPFAATEILRAPQAGLLAYKVPLGASVATGEVVAELVALDGEQAFVGRTPLRAGTAGVVISRNVSKYVWPGCSVAKISGTEVLASRAGYLLED